MKQKIKYLLASLALACGFTGFVVFQPALVSAQIKSNVCGGAELSVATTSSACTGGTAAESSLTTLIKNIVRVLSVIVGIVSVIMIIIGGFKYITSGGDSGNISSAKTTIIYALVGLVIVVLAQVIVRFVLSKTT